MGARFLGLRSSIPNNDNRKRGLDEVPIKPEEWRHPPRIETEPDYRWYCLVTVPSGEYRCADALSDEKVAKENGRAPISCYVPTEAGWTFRMKGRERLKVQFQKPLFRSYCFARLSRAFVQDEDTFARRLVLGSDWTPIYARDAYGKNPFGILGVMSNYGTPSPMPLRDAREARQGLADLADDEREGWFNDGLRAALQAKKDAMPTKPVLAGEVVKITGGPFAGHQGIAENDNVKDAARIAVSMFGMTALATIGLSDLENLTRPAIPAGSLRRA